MCVGYVRCGLQEDKSNKILKYFKGNKVNPYDETHTFNIHLMIIFGFIYNLVRS